MRSALVEGDAAPEERFRAQFANGIDVVVDHLWGRSADVIAANPVPLSEVEQAWARDDGPARTVLTMAA